ncbi:hypothetical protein SAMN05443549_105298 [Flavobacterium fluvii]|uniref:Uncharacterized protein n=1 Tax=Flavobacterium fluvii TaxID=468056 RepID=A0A1M5LQ52_9FLAO|nr:hypothetical protein SAMN05443549_105298 [Flavobacterium fluvii]
MTLQSLSVSRIRDGSGILLWSDSGTKDTADSPTRSFTEGHAHMNSSKLTAI